jgi:hypothetical protein
VRASVCVIACVSVVTVSACGTDPQPAAPSPAPPAFVRVDIDRTSLHDLAFPGDSLQLRAIASFDDGSRVDVTNEAAWSVVNPAVLAVSARGLVTAVDYGGSIVSVAYRNRAGEVNVSVRRGAPPLYPFTGVAVDGRTGAPVAGAFVEPLCGRTDGNGFFQCTAGAGAVLTISALGYADGPVTLPDGPPQETLRIPMTPHPGAFIERHVEAGFDVHEGGLVASKTIRIVTRAGGLFDAVVDSTTCDYNGHVSLTAQSGGVAMTGTGGYCYGRLRFVVPQDEIVLKVTGYKTIDFHLTYREPR